MLLLVPTLAYGEMCDTPPKQTMVLRKPLCNADAPCVAGQPVAFSIEPGMACTFISVCPPGSGYKVQPCDRVEWDFGDGTPKQAIVGGAQNTHAYAKPGYYAVRATVTNAHGSANAYGELLIADPSPALVRFAEREYAVVESAGSVTVRLLRSGNLNRTTTVDYHYSMIWDRDERRGTVTFAPGETSKSLTLPIADDTSYRAPITNDLFISSKSGETLFLYGSGDRVSIRVTDDDPTPTASIDDVRVAEGDAGRTNATFTISLSAPMPEQVTFFAQNLGGTAQRPDDYDFDYALVTMPAGQTSRTLLVPIVGDTTIENDEQFTIEFYQNSGPALLVSDGKGVGTIVNDDEAFADTSIRASVGSKPKLTLRLGASASERTIAVTSSDPSVLEVPATVVAPAGLSLVTFTANARSHGSATVRATLPSGNVAEARVIVYQLFAPVFPQTEVRATPGSTTTLALTTTPVPSSATAVTLTSSDPSILSVASPVVLAPDGTAAIAIEAKKAGTATITATVDEVSATATVIVQPVMRRRATR